MKVLIIGGVAAGTKTAAKLKREDRSIDVTVVTKDQDISYAGCGLPYYVGGFIESRDELIVNTPQKYSGLTGVEVRTGKEAVAVDPAKKEVTLKDVQTGNTEACPYDKLVIATGASAAELPIEGKNLPGVFKMRTPDDAEAIRAYAETNNVKKAVVIGAGFIGLEAAENLHARGINVTVIDFASQVLPNILDPEMAAYVKKHLLNAGIRVITGTSAEQILGTGDVEFAYNELWDSEDQFTSLRSVIEANKRYGGEDMQTVFAAYMNYTKADNTGTFNTPGVLLTDAVIFALGGSHLEMGEHMLCKEYFPNSNLGMSKELQEAIISYYDFLTAYQNILRDGGSFNEVSVASTDGKMNIKSWEPATGNVITLCRENGNLQAVHLLNFSQANSTSWRDMDGSMPEPALITDAALEIAADKEVAAVWMASPDIDGGAHKVLPFTKDGGKISITVPSLKYWDMIVIEYEN